MKKYAFALVGAAIVAACSSSKSTGTASSSTGTGNPTSAGNSSSTGIGNGGSTISSSTSMSNGGSTISSSTSMSNGGSTSTGFGNGGSSSTGFGNGGSAVSSSTGLGGGATTVSSSSGNGGAGTVASSSGGTGGCGTFSELKYTFTLASGFDWTQLRVTVNATAYMDDGTTQDQPEGSLLTSTSPTFSFSEFGCIPKVDVSFQYDNAPSASFSTDCTATATLKETNITIQPPTNTDQSTCTAPTPQ